MKATASYKGNIIAETDHYEIVDGNVYFPPNSLKKEYFTDSHTHTTCPYKGIASYYNIDIDGNQVSDAGWYYPLSKISNIEGYVAFYKNKVDVKKE